MRVVSIKKYLKAYKISSRKSTITNAFAAAVASFDIYDIERINSAIIFLGQNPDEDLRCVYCDDHAQTWDHLVCTVRQREFSGAGHRIGNLVPSCTRCNTRKRHLPFDVFIKQLPISEKEGAAKIALLQEFQSRFFALDKLPHSHPSYAELCKILEEVVCLMRKADELAEAIRSARTGI